VSISSIQGEALADEAALFASPQDVDKYVDQATDGIRACREAGRHPFPGVARVRGAIFSAVTENGLLVRELGCPQCRCAVRVELWESYGRGKAARVRFLSASVTYRTGPDGERYPAPPGRGRITQRAVKESIATAALDGTSITELKLRLPRWETGSPS
jgi:hypothetical protein